MSTIMDLSSKDETSIGMPRAQSSLELLSQTAIEIESANSSPRVVPPSSPARVTPAASVETLVLPEMVSHAQMMVRDPPQLMPRPDGLAMVASSLNLRNESMMDRSSSASGSSFPAASYGSMSSFQSTDEVAWLRQQLAIKDNTIAALRHQIQNLTQEIGQLRQLPTGKISQIPLEDMLDIMRTYGSEVSDMAMPPRKNFVQKASVVRQFRRWNPNFLQWFEHVNGRWTPKLGRAGELQRRKLARQEASTKRKAKKRS